MSGGGGSNPPPLPTRTHSDPLLPTKGGEKRHHLPKLEERGKIRQDLIKPNPNQKEKMTTQTKNTLNFEQKLQLMNYLNESDTFKTVEDAATHASAALPFEVTGPNVRAIKAQLTCAFTHMRPRKTNKDLAESVRRMGNRVDGIGSKVDRAMDRVDGIGSKVDRLDDKLVQTVRKLVSRIADLESRQTKTEVKLQIDPNS